MALWSLANSDRNLKIEEFSWKTWKEQISFGELYKASMRSSMGSSPKAFPWKIKKQTRDLGTTGREKTADSSFSQQHENDVTGKKRSEWDFSWGRSGAQHWVWNLSRNKGEWGQQSLRYVESPGRTQFQNQQAVNMSVLKMADEPKPQSEACWLSRGEQRERTRLGERSSVVQHEWYLPWG